MLGMYTAVVVVVVRENVIKRLGSLRQLDGKELSSEERRRYGHKLDSEEDDDDEEEEEDYKEKEGAERG